MSYIYSNSANFGNKFDTGIFINLIYGSTITTSLKTIVVSGNQITIVFNNTLSGPELTTLNNLVTNYNPANLTNLNIASVNLNGTGNPGPNNDYTQGYEIGTLWLNNTTNKYYICIGNTASSAIWKILTTTDASDLADGTVSNTKFQYINSLSSDVQAQINNLSTMVTDDYWIKNNNSLYYSDNTGTVTIGATSNNSSRLRVVGYGLSSTTPWLEIIGEVNNEDAGTFHYYKSGITDAPALKIRDLDNPPRIEFQQIGAGSITNPTHDVWFGMDSGLSNNMRLEGGNLGLGITPTQKLDVSGNIAVSGTVDGRDVSADGTTLDTHIANANIHVNHSTVSILAGIGMTGGGNITANRTLAMDINGLVEEAAPNLSMDYVAIYDTSGAITRKALLNNINNVFGTEYQYAESLGPNTNSTITNVLKLRLTTASIPAGNYRISWIYNWFYGSTNANFNGEVRVDSITVILTHVEEPKDMANTQRQLVSGFKTMALTSGVHTIDLNFRSGTAGTVATILNAALEIFRIS
jgi:hypothetical protein